MNTNVSQQPKRCEMCGEEFTPTGNRQKRCSSCKKLVDREHCRQHHIKTYERKGYNQSRENNNAWKSGIGWFPTLLTADAVCERCGVGAVLVHHRDGNRKNNDFSNLELLCKSCHQKHHVKRGPDGKFVPTHLEGIV